MSNITLVTGIWDIGRGDLSEGWSRPFQHYLDKFEKLLDVNTNMIIYGDKSLEEFVFSKRDKSNTQFIVRDMSWFRNNEFFDKIQNIRNNPEWYNQVGWLKDSTQSRLENYNPLVMSKVYLLNDAKIMDRFDSEYLFWIDGGLTNTVHPGYFTHDKVLDKLVKYISKFSFVCFPYEANTEVHGFNFDKMNSMAGAKVERVARGGFFGGPKHSISEINSIYYSLMKETLDSGYMGTEESLFSIMCYRHSELINYFEIESNGLLGKFFEDLKNDDLKVKTESVHRLMYDKEFILKTKKFLLDNSSDLSTTEEYKQLCDEYNFEHIKKDNLGICGGRQWIAEHFEETDLDYYLFFEDDMFFYPNEGSKCKNGFSRYEPNLFSISMQIMQKENFDFLKLNYSEFYGDNGTQWSWYNVPQDVRSKYWPLNPRLPQIGLDPNAPKTEFKKVLSHRKVPYATGDIYYCNWPQIISRPGNKKMFLDVTWAHPFEQTWMSHMYQLTKEEKLNPGLLLMTPTEHDRFEHYNRELRKES